MNIQPTFQIDKVILKDLIKDNPRSFNGPQVATGSPDKAIIEKDFSVERPMWYFSVYAHGKEQQNLIKGTDWSQEEARWAYESAKRMNGNIQNYILECQQRASVMDSETRKLLMDPVSVWKQGQSQQAFQGFQLTSQNVSAGFGSQPIQNVSSGFGSQPTQNTSQGFGTNFATNQPNQFGMQTNVQSFGAMNQFGGPFNHSMPLESMKQEDLSKYSETDLNAFKSPIFGLGKIPEIPPPYSLRNI